jgi:hypothetical protein
MHSGKPNLGMSFWLNDATESPKVAIITELIVSLDNNFICAMF